MGMKDSEADPECEVKQGRVRCEIDGSSVDMIGQEENKEAAIEAVGSAASRDTCAALSEAMLQEYQHRDPDEADQRIGQMGIVAINAGCPVPYPDRGEDDG